jgi:cytochrome c biogenesis protein CcmG/thiol:disulfide interchange protein DsbE
MKKLAALSILFVLTFSMLIANDLTLGSSAPTINIAEWLTDAPEGDDPFKGKTVVLEFWATWCGPCVRAIPHLNSLVDKYQSDDLIFVSVTKENKSKVTNFMKKKEMKAFVALDDRGKTNSAYRIRAIPKAYIISPEGKIIWDGHPVNLNDQLFDYYIANKEMPKAKGAPTLKKK